MKAIWKFKLPITDEKLKGCPIPGCGGAAVASPNKENARVVECSAQDCLTWLPVGLWQALPRASEAVLEVAREIKARLESNRIHPASQADLRDWIPRLESAAPGMGTPGSVWIEQRDLLAVARVSAVPIEVNGTFLIRRHRVHGTPQPKAEEDLIKCVHCGVSLAYQGSESAGYEVEVCDCQDAVPQPKAEAGECCICSGTPDAFACTECMDLATRANPAHLRSLERDADVLSTIRHRLGGIDNEALLIRVHPTDNAIAPQRPKADAGDPTMLGVMHDHAAQLVEDRDTALAGEVKARGERDALYMERENAYQGYCERVMAAAGKALAPVEVARLTAELSTLREQLVAAQRMNDDDSARLVEAKRDRDALREQLGEAENAKDTMSEYITRIVGGKDALAERVRELEGEAVVYSRRAHQREGSLKGELHRAFTGWNKEAREFKSFRDSLASGDQMRIEYGPTGKAALRYDSTLYNAVPFDAPMPPTTAEGDECRTCFFWLTMAGTCAHKDANSTDPDDCCAHYSLNDCEESGDDDQTDSGLVRPVGGRILGSEGATAIPPADPVRGDSDPAVAPTPRTEALRRAREQLEKWHFKYPSHERGGIGRFAAHLLEWAEDTDRRRAEARRQLGKMFVEGRDEAQLVLAVNDLIGEP